MENTKALCAFCKFENKNDCSHLGGVTIQELKKANDIVNRSLRLISMNREIVSESRIFTKNGRFYEINDLHALLKKYSSYKGDVGKNAQELFKVIDTLKTLKEKEMIASFPVVGDKFTDTLYQMNAQLNGWIR